MIDIVIFKNDKEFFVALLKNPNWVDNIKNIFMDGFKKDLKCINSFLQFIKNDTHVIKYRLFGIENNLIIFFAFLSHTEKIFRFKNKVEFYKKYSEIEYNNTINEMNIVKIKHYIFNICRNQDKIYKGVGSKILEKFYNYLKKQNITEIYLCPQYKYFENYYKKSDYVILKNLCKNSKNKFHPVMIKYL